VILAMSGLAVGLLDRPHLRGCGGVLVDDAALATTAESALQAKEWRAWVNRAAC